MASASSNPWKQSEAASGNVKPSAGAKGKASMFEQMGQPEAKPAVIRGKTTWGDTGHSGGHSNQGKFQKSKTKPKKSDFGPSPSLTDLP